MRRALFYFGGGEKPDAFLYPHDIIKFFVETKDRIFSECAPLYRKGHSLRETLNRRGLSLRNFNSGKKLSKKWTLGKRPGTRPYGFCYLDGQLVQDPKEFVVVRIIMKLWQSGKSFNAIADHLNRHGFKNRRGGKWEHPTIRSIVERQQKQTYENSKCFNGFIKSCLS